MRKYTILENELWWGCASQYGRKMPCNATTELEAKLVPNTTNNQTNPVLISSKGRYLWCEEGFNATFKDGEITIDEKVPPVSP